MSSACGDMHMPFEILMVQPSSERRALCSKKCAFVTCALVFPAVFKLQLLHFSFNDDECLASSFICCCECYYYYWWFFFDRATFRGLLYTMHLHIFSILRPQLTTPPTCSFFAFHHGGVLFDEAFDPLCPPAGYTYMSTNFCYEEPLCLLFYF